MSYTSKPAIEIKGVKFSYPVERVNLKDKLLKRDRFFKAEDTIFEDLNIDIWEGDRVGLIGLNGAGKSTLLKLMAGIYLPSLGLIQTRGKLGSILGDVVGLETEMSGIANIRSQLIIHETPRYVRETKTKEIAEFIQLGEYINRPVKTYSSGMRLKLAFGIITAQECDILIMDEAISAGDLNFLSRAQSRFERMLNKANVIVMASHNLEIIKNSCNRLIWLEDGKIYRDGNVEEVIAEYYKKYSA